jgi:hypothetical protein
MGAEGSADVIVRAMADRWGARVRASNLRWPGVGDEPFHLTCSGEVGGLPLRLRSSGTWLLAQIERPTALCFAGPVPDRILGADVPFGRFADLDIFVPAFAADDTATSSLRRWLATNAQRLHSVLADDERFLVACNESAFVLRPGSIESEAARLDELVALVSALPPEPPGELASAADLVVPLHLRSLASMASLWATGDDEGRADLIEAASTDDLRTLVDAVTPHLAEIDAALANGEAEEMLGLHELAQAALEARHELARRTR